MVKERKKKKGQYRLWGFRPIWKGHCAPSAEFCWHTFKAVSEIKSYNLVMKRLYTHITDIAVTTKRWELSAPAANAAAWLRRTGFGVYTPHLKPDQKLHTNRNVLTRFCAHTLWLPTVLMCVSLCLLFCKLCYQKQIFLHFCIWMRIRFIDQALVHIQGIGLQLFLCSQCTQQQTTLKTT